MATQIGSAFSKSDGRVTIAKVLTAQHGDDTVVQMVAAAKASSNAEINVWGKAIEVQQFKMWYNQKMTTDQLAKIAPSISKETVTDFKKFVKKVQEAAKWASAF
ncbi:unnamed protein product [Phytophthora fragariaefolia]|uniref:Unnamed protein product n=1 Tax=Phytophthora fragariaefolia TaxID=1490495 RepID=A0A9W6XT47_9STRA|nr:unnamed protein product [Phytophthora fragariaefolia]